MNREQLAKRRAFDLRVLTDMRCETFDFAAYRTGADRERAAALHRSLQVVRDAVAAGQRDAATIRTRALAVLSDAGIEVEYLELVTPEGLAPVTRIEGEVLAVGAARVGGTRLIDNERIQPLFAVGSGTQERETRPGTASGLTKHVA